MKTLKNKISYLLLLSICCLLSSCDNSHPEWEDGDPALAHVYYYCFEKWGKIPGGNNVSYTVKQGETLPIPTQFHSKYQRSYTPEVYYYTSIVPAGVALVCGTDYVVVDEGGNTLTPDASGAYKMMWPKAKAGVQNIYIKALNGSKGSFRVLTFDPEKKMDVTDVTTTSIIKTNEYEVRAMSENYFVTVIIE
ncbi:hypothetical protein [Bacteroides reticulotermitis]|uniref:hypothetical protein n=1 Tax=Bacteroides reticulotermitis TaxID=1133319 RepID=UPI003A8B34B6